MKRFFSLVIAGLICLLNTSVWAEKVSKEEATQLAATIFSAKTQTAQPQKVASVNTSATPNAKLNAKLNTTQLVSKQQLPSKGGALPQKQSGFTLNKSIASTQTLSNQKESALKVVDFPKSLEYDQFYIIQEDDEDGGWVMMSANDAVEPILAYSKTGTFRTDNMPINLKSWLGSYNEQIKMVTKLGLKADPAVAEEWTSLRKGVRKAKQAAVIDALVQTRWDQTAPYNNMCPSNNNNGQSVVGCVATAMAQVMKFHEWPEIGQGSNSYTDDTYGKQNVDFNTTYDWSNMPNRCYTTSSQIMKDAVAKLSYHCGVAVNMDYDNSANGGSGAYTLNYGSDNEVCAQNALWKYFKYDYSTIKSYYRDGGNGYSSWTQNNWIAMLKAELDQRRPIIYSGRGTGGGHCFICDGYDSDNKFHFNWGWSGDNDGFYTINNLVPGSGGAGGGSYSFNNSQGCIIGIKPVVSDKYTVTFNAGSLATCATATLKQQNVGDAITLPNVSSVANHYKFLGWSVREGSQTPDVGLPGGSYVPMRNITLYAVVVQDGYVVRFIPEIVAGTEVEEMADDDDAPYYWPQYNWTGHGLCDVDSLREEGIGSGIILPSASNNAGWTFQEWDFLSSSGSWYIAGYPGDRFYPSGNMNVYAYWTEDSKVLLDYLLMGVTKTSGPEEGWLEYADGLNATFTATEDFYPLTTANTTVTVKVDGEAVEGCYTIADNVLTITLSPAQIIGDVDITIQATQDYTPCSAYSYTYTQSQSTGTKNLGGYSWTISKTGSGSSNNYNTTHGQQFGTAHSTGNNGRTATTAGTVTYTTSTPAPCHINTLTVRCGSTLLAKYDYAGGTGFLEPLYLTTIEAFIGGTSLGIQGVYPDQENAGLVQIGRNTYYGYFPVASSDIVFQNTANLTGDLSFKITAGTGALIYVKSINVSMSESVLGGPYHVAVNGIESYYVEEDEGKNIWYTFLFGDGNYPLVQTIFDATEETSFAGTHSTYGISYAPKANTVIRSVDAPKLTLTYKQVDNTNTSPAHYIYHAKVDWYDNEGKHYYIDDDVSALLINDECWSSVLAQDSDAYLDEHAECIETPTSDQSNTKITYTVNYYLQKVDGSGYDLKESATFQTKSGNTVTGAQNSYTGFITPATKSIQVSNTNKTIDYYYDRRKYPVFFVVDNITVQCDTLRYQETPQYRGATPVRAATEDFIFEFAGWSPQFTPVKQSVTYTAQFTATAICTVTFNANGHGTAPAKQILNAGEYATNPGALTAEGYDFGGWYKEPGCANAWNFNTDVVNASVILWAKWTVRSHNITWNANEGTLSGTYSGQNNTLVAYGTEIIAPTAIRQGYTFAGWTPNVPDSMPDNDLSFTAQWTANTNTPYVVYHYKQNVDNDNFTLANTDELTGTTAASVTPDVRDYGAGFEAPTTQTVTIAANGSTSVTYNYTRKKFLLTWNTDGGNISGSYTHDSVKFEAPITKPENDNVTKTGYNFLGWAPDPTNYPTMPAEPLTFTAQWEIKTYDLTFTAGENGTVSVNPNKTQFNYNESVTITATAETGYHFEKWSDNNTDNPRTLIVNDNTQSLEATFAPNTNTLYTVHYFQQHILDDEYDEITPADSIRGTTGTLTDAAAKIARKTEAYTGFNILPWENVRIAGDGSTRIDVHYDRQTFVIRFFVNGVEQQKDTLRFGATPSFRGATPTKAQSDEFSYTWTGGWNPAISEVTKAQDYEAVFNANRRSYQITFNANGHGAAPIPQTVDYGTPATEPDALEETGWTFGGWFKEAECANEWNFNDPIEESFTLYAKWTVNMYDLTWNLAGGTTTTAGTGIASGVSSNTTTSQAYGTPIVAPAVERTGFNFTGWNPSVKETMPDENVTYVANWQEKGDIPYKVLHKRQNLAGTAFDIVEVENFTGVTGAPVTPLVKDYEGFDTPAQQTANILADGSLEIVYEYTRKSYSLVWDANGGALSGDYTHGSVKFEAEITKPADPVWEGHEFHNWAPNPDNYPTMPAGDLTFTAQWTLNSYSNVTFGSNDEAAGSVTVNPDDKTSFNYGETVEISATANSGYTFTGWSDGSDEANRTITITSDTALVANFVANTNTPYVVKYLLQNIEDDEFTEAVDLRQELTGTTGEWFNISPKTIKGFTTPGSKAGQQLKIAGDGSTVVEYRYIRNYYSIEWNANGGTLSGNVPSELKFDAQIAEPEISREGYTFKSWGSEVPANMPDSALSFTAQWEANKITDVNIASGEFEGGTVTVSGHDSGEYHYDDVVTITAEANEGYTFGGWSDSESETGTTRTITITSDTTIAAIFIPNPDTKYVVRILLQNVDNDNYTQLGEDIEHFDETGKEISIEPEQKEGFETPASLTQKIAGNGKTVFEFKYDRKSFNLEWKANGGTLLDNGRTEGLIRFGKSIVPAEVEWNGHIFQGWNPDPNDYLTMPARDLTFEAQWETIKIEGITFTTNDEKAGSITVTPESDIYEFGDTVTITATANEGYTFTGWSDGGTGLEREITIDLNTPDSIVALFTPNQGSYTIHILLQNIEDDEFTPSEEQVQVGNTGDLIEPEYIEGFTTPETQTLVIKSDGSSNDVELHYIRNTYKLVWDAAGGTLSGEYTSGEVKFGASITKPADPVREGFTFIGWELDLDEIPATMPAFDLTITALWEESQGIEIIVDGKTILSNEKIRIYDYNGHDVTGLNGYLGNGFYIVVGGGVATKIAIQ